MSLTIGTRLGPYEVVALVGAGGMGEVYRARDPRLGRDVAIKVLPAAFSADPDRLRRFEQEARAAAAINHPNILAVYDIGVENGAPYIVSELLDGETLRARLNSGLMPVRKVVDHAVQIAHGLSAAHDKGIAHRDLKPENLFVTTDARVKILDFGLAKLTQAEPAVAGASAPSTVAPDTQPGMVLGTVGYMAPEQVRGSTADYRADIFAFGAIVYEVLSGQRAFRGDTIADTMTAILKEEPPALPAAERHIPPALARIVDRCLEKDAAARFQSTSDLAFALNALSSPSGAIDAVAAAVTAAPRTRDRMAWWIAGASLAGMTAALVLAGALYYRRAPVETEATRFALSLPDGWSLQIGSTATGASPQPLAVSPDGRRIAFVARSATGVDRVWIRALDGLAARELAGTDGAVSPFWSPDSRFLGFHADRKLKKIEASGGSPITVCDAPEFRGATWSQFGVIVFATLPTSPLQRVSASGGTATPATVLAPGDLGHWRPSFLPDGRHFLYGVAAGGIYVGSADSTERTLVVKQPRTEPSNSVYTQGSVLFVRERILMAQPFDVTQLVPVGEARPIAEQIQVISRPGAGVFSASTTGVLAYQTDSTGSTPQLSWVDRTGKVVTVLDERATYTDVELSPNGRLAAVGMVDPKTTTVDIWLVDLQRRLTTRFTTDAANDVEPIWSPDGTRVAFASNRKGHYDVYQKAVDGSGDEELLQDSSVSKVPTSWSPDGRLVLLSGGTASTGGDMWLLAIAGDRKVVPFLQTPFNELSARFSADGRWVAYESNESGRPEVYVQPFPKGGKLRVSTSGGRRPLWRRDGKEIFYVAPDLRLMVAAVNGVGASFEVGVVQPFPSVRVLAQATAAYDVTADGQRVLLVTSGGPTTPPPVTVVLNWRANP